MLWLIQVGGQPKGWMYNINYLQIERHYQGLGKKSNTFEAHSCNFLDIATNWGVLLLREGVWDRVMVNDSRLVFVAPSILQAN